MGHGHGQVSDVSSSQLGLVLGQLLFNSAEAALDDSPNLWAAISPDTSV